MILDLTDPIARVRLAVADWQDIPILPDETYEYLLTKNSNNEPATIKEAAYIILGTLSFGTRQRLDRVEVYGNMSFDQYMKFIKEVIKNPSGNYTTAGVYAAGVYVSDVLNNQADTEVIQKRIPVGDSDNGQYEVLSEPSFETF